MGKAAEVASDGGSHTGDGGAGNARALRRRRRAARPTAQHTVARWRVRARRTFTVTSPLSASRADEKQFSASTEQVRERRARMGGDGGACGAAHRRRRGRGRQKGRSAAEGDSLVGPHGRAADAAVPPGECAAALRHGAEARRRVAAPAAAAAAPAATRRVTKPRRATSLPYHAYIPLSGRSHEPGCPRVPEYYRLGIYLFGRYAGRSSRGRTVRTVRTLRAVRTARSASVRSVRKARIAEWRS